MASRSSFRDSKISVYRWRKRKERREFPLVTLKSHASLSLTYHWSELAIQLCLGTRGSRKCNLWLDSHSQWYLYTMKHSTLYFTLYTLQHRILLEKLYFCLVWVDEKYLAYSPHSRPCIHGQNTKGVGVFSLRSGNWQFNGPWILVSSCPQIGPYIKGKWLEWKQLHIHWYVVRPYGSKWIFLCGRRLGLGCFKRFKVFSARVRRTQKSLHGGNVRKSERKGPRKSTGEVQPASVNLFFYLSSHLYAVTWWSHISAVITGGEEVRASNWKKHIMCVFFFTSSLKNHQKAPGVGTRCQVEKSGKIFIGYGMWVLIDFVLLYISNNETLQHWGPS